jgi:hypothetical protein
MWVGAQCHALEALPAGKRPGTHRKVGLKAGLDKRRKSLPQRDSIPEPFSLYQIAINFELFLITDIGQYVLKRNFVL